MRRLTVGWQPVQSSLEAHVNMTGHLSKKNKVKLNIFDIFSNIYL